MSSVSAIYTIKAAAARAGLSPHTVRAWERRYHALAPSRTETNRRLYGEEEVERLCLLGKVVEAGHSIGNVAQLPTAELRALAQSPPTPRVRHASLSGSAGERLARAQRAVVELDSGALEAELERARALDGVEPALDSLVVPLLEFVGTEWEAGRLRIAQEHAASAVIRGFLDRTFRTVNQEGSPKMIVATMPEELHELGAMMVAIVASLHGWSCLYLGANAPADEIAAVANSQGARAICLSVVNRGPVIEWQAEIDRLRSMVGRHCAVILGGRGASEATWETFEPDVYRPESLGDFRRLLEDLRPLAR